VKDRSDNEVYEPDYGSDGAQPSDSDFSVKVRSKSDRDVEDQSHNVDRSVVDEASIAGRG